MMTMNILGLTVTAKIKVITLRTFVSNTFNWISFTAIASNTTMNYFFSLVLTIFKSFDQIFLNESLDFILDLLNNFSHIFHAMLSSLFTCLAWFTFWIDFGSFTFKAQNMLFFFALLTCTITFSALLAFCIEFGAEAFCTSFRLGYYFFLFYWHCRVFSLDQIRGSFFLFFG